jgi:DNA-binding transcriptional regulator YiaG
MTIKEARIAANLTQKQLSDMLEIPLRTIESWEGGQRKPPAYVESLIVEKLQQISKAEER